MQIADLTTEVAWVGSIVVGAVHRGQLVRSRDRAFGEAQARAMPRVLVSPRPGGVTLLGAF